MDESRRATKVSCTIIARDEEDRILRCLESVRSIASEIVVVDSGSTDATVALCEAFGATVFVNPWTGYGPQKRYAEDRAQHDWVLNLDADEWLPDAVRREIARLLDGPIPEHVFGYQFRIMHVYPGKSRPRRLADYHRYVRLYDKTKCRFPDSAVFDEIKVEERHLGRIANPIYHQSLRSLRHLIRKNTQYYAMQRSEVGQKSLLNVPRLIVEPVSVFLKYYLLKRHFTGGIYGFLVASTIAGLRTYRLARFVIGHRPR